MPVIATPIANLHCLLVNPDDSNTLLAGTDRNGLQVITIAPDILVDGAATVASNLGSATSVFISVKNQGLFDATGISVTAHLPTSATDIKADVPGGTCAVTGRSVACTIDVLRTNADYIVTIDASYHTAGLFQIPVAVSGDQPDMLEANNSKMIEITVSTPALTESKDGGGGATSILMLLSLAFLAAHSRRSFQA
jgi:hypothetical protein